jgi:outer membrane biosynthesis protein TonB
VTATMMTMRAPVPPGLRKMITASLVVHLAALAGMALVPREWLSKREPARPMMSVSLGSSGERTGGMNAAGAQQVEEVAPPPKRPVPLPAVQPKPETAIAVPKTPPKPAPPQRTTETAAAVITPRPPVTAPQPTAGTARTYTPTTAQGTGLSMGGGAGGAVASFPADFCCPQYIEELLRRIAVNWRKSQQEQGTTTIKFVINRDGSFSRPEIEQSSGSVLLDVTSKDAFNGLRLDPLPKPFTEDKLTIHLKFPYVR